MATNPLTSIANMFRPVQQVTVAPAAPLAQQNPGAAAPIPPAGTSLPTPAEPANPLDDLTALWQNDPNAAPNVDPLSTPLFKTDPAAIQAAASKVDFLSQIPQNLMAKAMSGQDPASFLQVLNAVAQRTLATATQLNAATQEQATTRNNQRILDALPGRVKKIQLDSMVPDNPALQHPASQPLLQLVRSQLQMKNPNMSAAQLNKRAEEVLVGYASQIAGPSPSEQATAQAQAGGTDWDNWAAT